MAGLFGVSLNEDCWEDLEQEIRFLRAFRGNASGGFAFLNKGKIQVVLKKEGFLDSLFKTRATEEYGYIEGNTAIGAVSFEAQPPIAAKIKEIRNIPFVLAGDTKIVNRDELKEKFLHLDNSLTDLDICAEIAIAGKDSVEKLKLVSQYIKGRYNLVLLSPEGIFNMRDPWGFNSFPIGRSNEGTRCAVVSESAGLEQIDIRIVRETKRGEINQIEPTGFNPRGEVPSKVAGLCFFNFIYGLSPASYFEDSSIWLDRFDFGRKLAQRYPVDGGVVSAFPLSAIAAAQGFAYELGLPYVVTWQYNPLGPSYKRMDRDERQKIAKAKLSPFEEALRMFNKITFVEDSIVGAVQLMARIFEVHRLMAKFHGPKNYEIRLRVSCPPKKYPCILETPYRPQEELIAAAYDTKEELVEGLRDKFQVNSLEFGTLRDDLECILSNQSPERKAKNPTKVEDICTCCLTGENMREKYFK